MDEEQIISQYEELRRQAIRALSWCAGWMDATSHNQRPPVWVLEILARLIANDPYWVANADHVLEDGRKAGDMAENGQKSGYLAPEPEIGPENPNIASGAKPR